MKRLIAFMLSIVMITAVGIFAASAAGSIDSGLMNLIDRSAPDDVIEIIIFCRGNYKTMQDMSSWPDRIAAAEEYEQYSAEVQKEIQPQIFDGTEAEDIRGFLPTIIIASVKASDIKNLANNDIVRKIYQYEDVEGTADSSELYKERFYKEYLNMTGYVNYKELYYHTDDNGAADWVMVKAERNSGVEDIIIEIVGNRVIFAGERMYPFTNCYGIYDVKEDRFVSIITGSKGTVSGYEGLGRAYDEYGTGRLLGDIDLDDELTIIDCTLMQRCATRVRDWPENDKIEHKIDSVPELKYYSDFDRDGERDAVDATKLQRYVTLID